MDIAIHDLVQLVLRHIQNPVKQLLDLFVRGHVPVSVQPMLFQELDFEFTEAKLIELLH